MRNKKCTQIVAVARFLINVFKCKFEKFLMNTKAMCLYIKVAQLATLSVGKESTGIGLVGLPGRGLPVFLMRWKMKTQIYVN